MQPQAALSQAALSLAFLSSSSMARTRANSDPQTLHKERIPFRELLDSKKSIEEAREWVEVNVRKELNNFTINGITIGVTAPFPITSSTGLEALINFISKNNIRSLCFQHCRFNPRGLENTFDTLCRGLDNCTSLQSLTFEDCDLSCVDIKLLGTHLVNLKMNLELFKLSMNPIIRHTPDVNIWNCFGNFFHKNLKLARLDLSGNSMGDIALGILLNTLDPSLKYLGLNENELEDVGVDHIRNWLVCVDIDKKSRRFCAYLNLRDNNICDRGFKNLVECTKTSGIKIMLSKNRISQEAIRSCPIGETASIFLEDELNFEGLSLQEPIYPAFPALQKLQEAADLRKGQDNLSTSSPQNLLELTGSLGLSAISPNLCDDTHSEDAPCGVTPVRETPVQEGGRRKRQLETPPVEIAFARSPSSSSQSSFGGSQPLSTTSVSPEKPSSIPLVLALEHRMLLPEPIPLGRSNSDPLPTKH